MSHEPTEREFSLREVRLGKLERLRALRREDGSSLDPYLVERFDSPETAAHLVGDGFEEAREVSFAGRVVSYRLMGKAGFAHLSDGDGRVQAYFRRDDLSPEQWEAYGLLDIGDHVGVTGYLFLTKTGERSIHVRTLTPLSKALHALPIGKEKDGETFSGLSDPELRFRHRHLDLIANRDAREKLINRARIVSAVRRYFDSLGYLEVETPMLQLEAGGAAARPFRTHYNAYDLEVKLRISLELYLKRLICGDIPKVYEVGRVFRNEGVSNRHSPEFTMLEFYEAYVDLETMMERVEGCFKFVVDEVLGGAERFQHRQLFHSADVPIDFLHLEAKILLGILPIIRVKEIEQRDGPFERHAVNPGDAFWGVMIGDESDPNTYWHENLSVYLDEGTVDISTNSIEQEWLEVRSESASFSCDNQIIQLDQGIYKMMPYNSLGLNRAILGSKIDFHKPWNRVHLLDEIERLSGVPQQVLRDLDSAKAYLGAKPLLNPINGKTIDPEEENNLGGLIEKLLEVFVEPTLQEPTFVVGYPIETSPLAKKDPNRPGFTRRFEGYVLGREICNAFSEINDPIDQRERFEQQLGERAKGDDEAHPMDEEFLFALESGMPPTGGCGIGLDRMAMLLTGAPSIREVLMFPMMKPSSAHEGE